MMTETTATSPLTGSEGATGKLRKRRDFVRAQAGRKSVRQGFILRMRPQRAGEEREARTGLTVSKKVGGAVERNRVRRRLRSAAAQIAPSFSRPGNDYVFIARRAALTLDFGALLNDMKLALSDVHDISGSRPEARRNTR